MWAEFCGKISSNMTQLHIGSSMGEDTGTGSAFRFRWVSKFFDMGIQRYTFLIINVICIYISLIIVIHTDKNHISYSKFIDYKVKMQQRPKGSKHVKQDKE